MILAVKYDFVKSDSFKNKQSLTNHFFHTNKIANK